MDIRDCDDWPMNIRKIDGEQLEFHRTVSSVFFLILDGNDQTLPLATMRELCRLPNSPDALSRTTNLRADQASLDEIDNDYGLMLDIMESLKMSIADESGIDEEDPDDEYPGSAEFAQSLFVHDDDAETPQYGLTERRGTKPS